MCFGFFSCKEEVAGLDEHEQEHFLKQYGTQVNEYYNFVGLYGDEIVSIGGYYTATRTSASILQRLSKSGVSIKRDNFPMDDHTWFQAQKEDYGTYVNSIGGPEFYLLNGSGKLAKGPGVIDVSFANPDYYLYSKIIKGEDGLNYLAASDFAGTGRDSSNNFIVGFDDEGKEESLLNVPDSVIIPGGRVLLFNIHYAGNDEFRMSGTCQKVPYWNLADEKTFVASYNRTTGEFKSTVLDIDEDGENDICNTYLSLDDGGVVLLFHNWYYHMGTHSTAGVPFFEVARFDAKNNLVWRKKVDMDMRRLYPTFINHSPNGFLMGGFGNSKGATSFRPFVVALDLDGNVRLNKIYYDLTSCEIYHGTVDDDKMYLGGASFAFGNSKEQQSPFLLVTDRQGNYK